MDIRQLQEYFDLTDNECIRLRQIGKALGKESRDFQSVNTTHGLVEWFNSSPLDVNTFASPNGCMRGKAFERAYVVFAEIDKGPDGAPIPHAEQMSIVKNLVKSGTIPQPWFAVKSRKSIHFYWRLDEPLLDAGLWSRIQSALAYTLGADTSLSDVNQLMRVPGLPYRTGDDSLVCELIIPDRNRKLTNVSEFDGILATHAERVAARHDRKRTPRDGSKFLSDDILEQAIHDCENPEILFNWPMHEFESGSGNKYRGDCPHHNSSSGTSFWIDFNDNDNWDWGCTVCTENLRGNVYAYRHWLKTGVFEQPRGADYAKIRQELASDLGVTLPQYTNGNAGKPEEIAIAELQEDDSLSAYLKHHKTLEVLLAGYHDKLTHKGFVHAKSFATVYSKTVDMSVKAFEETYISWLTEQSFQDTEDGLLSLEERVKKLEETSIDLDIVPGWLRKGELTLLTGDSGSGKSSLLGDVIHSFLHGGIVFARRLDPIPGKILLVNSDESATDTANRMRLRGTDISRIINPSELDLDRGGLAKLDRWMGEFSPSLVVIDSLTSVTQSTESDENQSKFALYLYQLKNLASKHGITVIVTHHTNKAGKVAGSRRLVAPCWSVISVDYPHDFDPESTETTAQRTIRTRKCRGGQKQAVNCELRSMLEWQDGIFGYTQSDLYTSIPQRELLLQCDKVGYLEIPKQGEIRADSLTYKPDVEKLLGRGYLIVGNGILRLSPRGKQAVVAIRGG